MANMTSSVSASQVAGELASATFEEIPALVEHYREDPRQQVIKACERALKRHAKELAERERVNGMYELMHELGGDGVVVGVDEVGRGSVAGPLTVCAVCLPMEPRIWGINDSKKLTPARRELLSVKIAEVATLESAVSLHRPAKQKRLFTLRDDSSSTGRSLPPEWSFICKRNALFRKPLTLGYHWTSKALYPKRVQSRKGQGIL